MSNSKPATGRTSRKSTRSQRVARPCGAKKTATQPQAALDPRLFAVIFDSLGVAAGIAASAATGCSFRELRESTVITPAEHERLQAALNLVLQEHAGRLAGHQDGIALAAIVSGIAAAQVQTALVLAAAAAEADGAAPEPLSPLAAALLVLLILAPFIVLLAAALHGQKGKRK